MMKMKKAKNNLSSIVIALLLLTLMGGSTMVASVKADLPALSNLRTYAFVTASPNPDGVGQQVFIDAWLLEYDALAAAANGQDFQGFTITVTGPAGVTATLGPFTASDAST